MNPAPSFREAFIFWLKLGFISFGGPAGQIAIMHEYIVEQKKWLSNQRFLHALNYCMVLPGPEAQQLATYIGWLLHGHLGGLVAGILFVLPSVFILFGLSAVYVSFGSLPWVYALFTGIKPAVLALIVLALIKIAKKSMTSFIHYLWAILAFVAIFFFNISFPLIIGVSILVGILGQYASPKMFGNQTVEKTGEAAEEAGYYINQKTLLKHTSFSWKTFFIQVLTAIVLWILPFIAFYSFSSDFAFWSQLSLFFTQAAFVTFGGAYAVLPYVAQVSVEQLGWLTEHEMIDGLALGESTPGPLVMVLAYVGFMGGYHHFSGSLLLGGLALLTTVYYTFLPCFFFIFAGAPLIEKTGANQKFKNVLSLISAAVVGVILNLCLFLGKAVFAPKALDWASLDYLSISWFLISLLALYRYKINIILWIALSMLFGLLIYFL